VEIINNYKEVIMTLILILLSLLLVVFFKSFIGTIMAIIVLITILNFKEKRLLDWTFIIFLVILLGYSIYLFI
jgi:hypothetical protein